jgi:hypothetical protein
MKMTEEQNNEEQSLDRFKPVEGEVKPSTTFKTAEAISRSYNPPLEQPVDLIRSRMKETGQVPGRGGPTVFVGEDGKPIFKDPVVGEKLELPPVRDKVSTFKIDGYEIPLCGVAQLDALTCFMYIMSRLAKENPEIDRILTAFKFAFPDATGKIIYPVQEDDTKKSKKKK